MQRAGGRERAEVPGSFIPFPEAARGTREAARGGPTWGWYVQAWDGPGGAEEPRGYQGKNMEHLRSIGTGLAQCCVYVCVCVESL